MKRAVVRLKLIFILAFAIAGAILFAMPERLVQVVEAFADGPPAGHTGAPGEQTCTNCHFNTPGPGQISITAPPSYVPGQTYQIVVRHTTSDQTRQRWGFQLTSLAGENMAGSYQNLTGATQIVGGVGRDYIEHTNAGTFPGTTSQASWTFNWIAPPANVGTVTFYTAGNQANNDGTSSNDRIVTATATSEPLVEPPAGRPFDFDGDGKTDIGIFRPSDGTWWINRSSNSSTIVAGFGSGSDVITPGDFTGDGKTDIAFWRPSNGFWFVLRSEDSAFFAFPFGTSGDIPVPADYDNDGKTDAAVFRPSNGTWFLLRSTAGVHIELFGQNGDHPVAADYDGDGRADLAIFRPADGTWWLNRSTAGLVALAFGNSSDKQVPGDFTGDGKTDIAFWRPSNGFWFVLRSEDFAFFAFPFGTDGDIPAPGDYDGDGRFDATVFRPSNATWFVLRSTAGVFIQGFGANGDRPVANAFVP